MDIWRILRFRRLKLCQRINNSAEARFVIFVLLLRTLPADEIVSSSFQQIKDH
jgi:hypothetical protein